MKREPAAAMRAPRAGRRLALALLACALVAPGCASLEPNLQDLEVAPAVVEGSTRYRKEYVVGPGDVLEVLVVGNAAVSRTVTVRPDGYVSLPILDDVEASGLTISELDARVTELFSKRLRNPEVTVIAATTRPARALVFGEVQATRAVELREAATVAEAVIVAGGFGRRAAPSYTTIVRLNEAGRLVAITPALHAESQVDPYMILQTMPLEPDDMIFVPATDVAKFNDWVDSYINGPLSGLNSILTTYVNFRWTQVIGDAVQ
ncbi:MAG: polysaccharide biosynthesis/export family protein [Planctomycetota bacterium]